MASFFPFRTLGHSLGGRVGASVEVPGPERHPALQVRARDQRGALLAQVVQGGD